MHLMREYHITDFTQWLFVVLKLRQVSATEVFCQVARCVEFMDVIFHPGVVWGQSERRADAQKAPSRSLLGIVDKNRHGSKK